MKLTNLELSTVFIPALQELATIRTSTKIAYNTAKTIKSAIAFDDIYQLARKAILEAGALQKDGKAVIDTVKSEYVFANEKEKALCMVSLNELAAVEVEFNIFPIKLVDLGDIKISAKVLVGLKEFIEET